MSPVDSTAAGSATDAKITLKIKDFRGSRVVLELENRLAARLRAVLKEKYALDIANIPLETPPDPHLGEIATPIALQLARTLRKAPKWLGVLRVSK
jgi:hypothetical protein